MMSSVIEELASLDLVQLGNDRVQVVFVPETLQLYRLSPLSASVLRDGRDGLDVSELTRRHGLPPEAVRRFLENLVAGVRAGAPAAGPLRPSVPTNPIGPVLPKLVLMVNNYCNLKCTYCYEHETVFTKKAIDMNPHVVRTALGKFYGAFQGVREVMFIGGEPSISEDVVSLACETATGLAAERGWDAPAFCMISNGVQMSERMFETIHKYQVQVTFSMDGPASVQDAARVRHDDTGSYAVVAGNLKRYVAAFPERAGVECTVTQVQRKAGVTVSDLVDFFAREFGVREPHVAPAGLAPGDPLNPYPDDDPYIRREFEQAAEKSMDNLLAVLSGEGDGAPGGRLDMVASMLRTLLRRRSTLDMCPAGTAQLVVDAFGDIYPCWMFAGMEPFRMGNVLRDEVFNDLAAKVLGRIHRNTKKTNPQCSACYARHACNACIGNNQNATGAIEMPDERFCDMVRGTLRTVLLRVGEARQDEARWALIQANAARGRKEELERVRK
jgi:uncharacterized protein